jgi:hypothetical protein
MSKKKLPKKNHPLDRNGTIITRGSLVFDFLAYHSPTELTKVANIPLSSRIYNYKTACFKIKKTESTATGFILYLKDGEPLDVRPQDKDLLVIPKILAKKKLYIPWLKLQGIVFEKESLPNGTL